MKNIFILLFAFGFLINLQAKGQGGRVGIGTNNPLAKLSIDSGLNIDQSNVNGVLLESALTFGNNKKVGIGSRRTAGTNQAGLDFYTQGSRRMVIDSFGNVGIGTTTPDRRLHVEGTIYGGSYIISSFGIASGIGNVLPSYDVHAGVGYFTTRLGIGTFPTSTYALDVDNGPVRIRQDARIDGILNPNNALTIGNSTTVDGNLTVTGSVTGNLTVSGDIKVNANKGIVRSHNSTQVKIVRTTITLSGSIGAGSHVDSGDFAFEAFGGNPQVILGNMISASNSNWAKLVFVPFDVDENSCKFRVFNHGEEFVSVEVTYSLLLVGPE
jgi:cytoskeletal protein CcmA (bactofilin family)